MRFISKILFLPARCVAASYHFFWHVVMQRPEPYTRQLCRMEEAYPTIFWGVFTILNGLCWYHLFHSPTFIESLTCLGLILAGVWLIGHIIDYIQAHPEKTPDPPECE
jgi:hypothetical protein